jgi:hypothetical protein
MSSKSVECNEFMLNIEVKGARVEHRSRSTDTAGPAHRYSGVNCREGAKCVTYRSSSIDRLSYSDISHTPH